MENKPKKKNHYVNNKTLYYKSYVEGISRNSQVSDIRAATSTAYGFGGLEFG